MKVCAIHPRTVAELEELKQFWGRWRIMGNLCSRVWPCIQGVDDC